MKFVLLSVPTLIPARSRTT